MWLQHRLDCALGPIISGSGLPAIGSTWSWYASEDRRPLDYCSPISDYSLKAALDGRTGFNMSVSTEQVARLTTRGKVPDDSDATQTPTNVIASGQLVVCPASRDQASFRMGWSMSKKMVRRTTRTLHPLQRSEGRSNLHTP